jgi:NitT/TauT family transport system permease protein
MTAPAVSTSRSKSVGMIDSRPWHVVVIRYGYPMAFTLATLLVWEFVSQIFEIPTYLLPPPSDIASTLVADWSIISANLWPTLLEVIMGYALSIVIGVPLATVIVCSPLAERVLYPPMVASQAIPKVAIAPLFIVWMGYGLMPKIWIAFLIAFFPIVIDTIVGLRSTQPAMLQLGRSMGAGPITLFLKVRLPHALPNLFGGLKVAITLSMVGAITGEFVGSQRGLGYLLTSASGNMDTALVFAVLVTISVAATVLFVLVEMTEKFVIPWHSSIRSKEGGGH